MSKIIISVSLMVIATFLNTITKLSFKILNKGEGTVNFKVSKVSNIITNILKVILFLVGLAGTIYYGVKLKLLILL